MLFARHGESTHNTRPDAAFDIGDTEITARGREQAYQLGHFLATQEFDLVGVSPSHRTFQTWNIAASVLPASPHALITAGFREFDWGDWAGKSIKDCFTPEIEAAAELAGRDFRANPAADTINEAGAAMYDAIARRRGEIGLVVSHNFAIKSLIGRMLDWDRRQLRDFKIGNGEVISFDPRNPEPPVVVFSPMLEVDDSLQLVAA